MVVKQLLEFLLQVFWLLISWVHCRPGCAQEKTGYYSWFCLIGEIGGHAKASVSIGQRAFVRLRDASAEAHCSEMGVLERGCLWNSVQGMGKNTGFFCWPGPQAAVLAPGGGGLVQSGLCYIPSLRRKRPQNARVLQAVLSLMKVAVVSLTCIVSSCPPF